VLRAWTILFLFSLTAAPVWAHGGEPPPPPEPPEEPGNPPLPDPPPPTWPPAPLPPPHEGDPPPQTPLPEPDAPTPRQPKPRNPAAGRSGPRKPSQRRASTRDTTAWREWWDYNREDLIGMRGRVRAAITTSGSSEQAATPLGARRKEVRDILRQIALHDPKIDVRAAATIALGRMGNDDDARSFLRLLHAAGVKQPLKEAAAVALAIVPPIQDPAVRKQARDWLLHVIRYDKTLPSRVRGLCLLASGMRAGSEPLLMMQLAGRAAGQGFDSEEAGTLAYALGLSGHPMAAPELARAAKHRKLGKEKLTDVGRSHATQGLALIGDSTACRSLIALLGSRRAGEHTRRSAALGLGRILSSRKLEYAMVASISKALEKAIDKDNDLLVKGFSAIALGTVRTSAARESLAQLLRGSSRAELKPFLALGLGIWAKRAGPASRKQVHGLLARSLNEAKDPELAGALCIACGLAEASDARELMLEVLTGNGDAAVRGAAAQGLGLLGKPDPSVIVALEKVLEQGDRGGALPDAALALGLLGRRASAGELARELRKTSSSVVQGRIILALGHLGHSEAIDPLLAILQSREDSTLVREFAAVALGLMGDKRARDPLFAADAWFNYYATTQATNEFLRLY
jgi:HEAT repeat protein